MKKIVKLNIAGARVFLPAKEIMDMVITPFPLRSKGKEFFYYKRRDTSSDMDNIVWFSHVSNMLHVLLNARPVQSKGYSTRTRCQAIDNIAQKGFIKIEEFSYYDKNGKKCYVSETMSSKKSAPNATRSTGFTEHVRRDDTTFTSGFTWSTLYKKYGIHDQYCEKYHKIINALTEMAGECGIKNDNIQKDYTLLELIENIAETSPEWKQKLMDFQKTYKLGDIKSFLVGKSKSLNCCQPGGENLGSLLENHGISNFTQINASIYLPLEEDEYQALLSGPRTATFLDGGVATVEAVYGEYDIDTYDLTDEGYVSINTLKK